LQLNGKITSLNFFYIRKGLLLLCSGVALTCLQGKQVNQHNPAILGEMLRIFILRQVQSEEVKQAYEQVLRGKRKHERKKEE